MSSKHVLQAKKMVFLHQITFIW